MLQAHVIVRQRSLIANSTLRYQTRCSGIERLLAKMPRCCAYEGVTMTEPLLALGAGILLIVLALIGGGVEIKEFKVKSIGPMPRLFSGLLGAFLLYNYFFEKDHFITPTDNNRNNPPQQSSQTNIPGTNTITDSNGAGAQPSKQSNHETPNTSSLIPESSLDKSYNDSSAKKKEKELHDLQARLEIAIKELENTTRIIKKSSNDANKGLNKEIEPNNSSNIEKKLQSQKVAVQETKNAIKEKKKEVSDANEKAPSSVFGEFDASKQLPIIGYVLFAEIDHDNSIRKAFFSIKEDNKARFPGPNDIIVAMNKKIALRAYPFHWDPGQKRIVQESPPLTYVTQGQKLKVGGDVFISTDPQNKHQYAIAPISQTLDRNFSSTGDVYISDINSPNLIGYVYLGLIDEDTGGFADKFFENKTHPDITVPVPDDRLLAKRDTNIRKGPRYWDNMRGDYVFPPIVGVIKAGDIVVVGGDTVLSKQGQSVWTPISRD